MPDDNKVYTVAIKFQEFESAQYPLSKLATASSESLADRMRTAIWQDNAGHVYYWSFNQSSQLPDLRAHPGALISFNEGMEPSNFTAKGWASNGYPAGQAMSITGLETLLIQMPLQGITALTAFGFDISSSATGPKDFSIWYSQDGVSYQLLQADNQFSNVAVSYPKNSFRYYIDELVLDFKAPLFIKLIPKAGIRGEGGNYNPRQGVTRLDNIYLAGIAGIDYAPSIRQLDYRIFEKETNQLVQGGSLALDNALSSELNLELSKGAYKAVFVYNASEAFLQMPESSNALDFYVANIFSNKQAQVFAAQREFQIAGNMQMDLQLDRLYSQVKFEFTDTKNLSTVGRLEIRPLHASYFYAPFNVTMVNPITDDTFIIQAVDFENTPKELFFNQFLGFLSEEAPVAYAVDVFDKDGQLLRSFRLESMLRNNVQLVFRGALLAGQDKETNFSIRLNEEWGEYQEVKF